MIRGCKNLLAVALSILTFGAAPSSTLAEGGEVTETEVLVSAQRIESARNAVGSALTVISREQIDQRGYETVQEVLEDAAGVDVVRSGGRGGNASIFIRGANSEHTLVVVDGVEINNPVNPSRAYNLAFLALDNVERIEVLRGPQSMLYGSDALGGVINIVTRKGEGKPQGSVSFEGGSYQTFTERADLAGSEGRWNYSLGATREDTSGFSAAAARYGNSEHDGYASSSFAGRVGADLSDGIAANLFLRYLDSTSELDNSGGLGGDDPNRELDNNELYARGEVKAAFFDDRLRQTYAVSWSDQSYDDDNDPDAEHPLDLLRSDYDGDLLKFEFLNWLKASDWLSLLAGIETEDESASSYLFSDSEFGPFESIFPDKSARTTGYLLDAQLSAWDGAFVNLGLRADDHEQFGSEVTYRISPVVQIGESGPRLFASVGTAFKAPSLYQLYSEYGSLDLQPEENLGVDAGFEQALWEDRARVGASMFWNSFDNLITFDPDSFVFQNIQEAESSGFELFTEVELTERVGVELNYTYTDTEDKGTGEQLLRRPRNKIAAYLNIRPVEKLSVVAGVRGVGVRDDNDFSTFPASRVELAGYAVVDLSVAYELEEHVQIFARVENLFDQDYEEVLGYGTAGAGAYGGIKVTL